MNKKRTQQRGGGYINEVSVAKSRAIKTPLHLYSEWNIKVNKCNSLEEIQTLLKKDKNNQDCIKKVYYICLTKQLTTTKTQNNASKNYAKTSILQVC